MDIDRLAERQEDWDAWGRFFGAVDRPVTHALDGQLLYGGHTCGVCRQRIPD